jgi:ribosomal protein L16 Arg81 hydroxylase
LNISQVDLEWLIAPTNTNDFFSNYWGRAPFRLERKDSSYYRCLLPEENLEFTLYSASEFPGALEILSEENLPRPCGSYGQAIDAFSQGCSIRIGSIQRFLQPVNSLCQNLEQIIGFQLNANMYLTPGSGKKALRRHYDLHDVFVVQIHGNKLWRLYDPPHSLPLGYLPLLRNESMNELKRFRLNHHMNEGDKCTVAQEFTLEAGDCLYLPRGFWHEAEGRPNEVSCHLTFGILPVTYLDLISLAVSNWAMSDPSLREGLPAGFISTPQKIISITNRANDLLADLSKNIDIPSALNSLISHHRRKSKPRLEQKLLTPRNRLSPSQDNGGNNWLPIYANLVDAQIKWLDFGVSHLGDPFFQQSVNRLMTRKHKAATLETSLTDLPLQKDAIPPSGFIFHISRCGSTLLSNCLRKLEGTVVISEAQPINAILSTFSNQSSLSAIDDESDAKIALFNSFLRAYGQRRVGSESSLIIKFSSVNILQIRLLRKHWPHVPCIVIIRDPLEVAVSCLRSPTGWMRRRDSFHLVDLVDSDANGKIATTDMRFCAQVIAKFIECAVQARDEMCRIIDYSEINQATVESITRFFGIKMGAIDQKNICIELGLYSKDVTRSRLFTDDRATKKADATDELRNEIDRWALTSYKKAGELENSST